MRKPWFLDTTRVNETTVVRAVHTRFAEDETRQKPQQGGV